MSEILYPNLTWPPSSFSDISRITLKFEYFFILFKFGAVKIIKPPGLQILYKLLKKPHDLLPCSITSEHQTISIKNMFLDQFFFQIDFNNFQII